MQVLVNLQQILDLQGIRSVDSLQTLRSSTARKDPGLVEMVEDEAFAFFTMVQEQNTEEYAPPMRIDRPATVLGLFHPDAIQETARLWNQEMAARFRAELETVLGHVRDPRCAAGTFPCDLTSLVRTARDCMGHWTPHAAAAWLEGFSLGTCIPDSLLDDIEHNPQHYAILTCWPDF